MINKKLKKVIVCVPLILSMISTTAFAGTWKQDRFWWKYINDDGSYARNQWIYDNGWYYIANSSDMVTGIVFPDIVGKAIGGTYCFDKSGKLSTGGFVEGDSSDYKYFTDKDGHPVDGVFMVDGVLYKADYNKIFANAYPGLLYSGYTKGKEDIEIDCYFDNGKLLDKDRKPFEANSKLFANIKYLPQYDSKGNLIREIKNENGLGFSYLINTTIKARGPM